MQEQSASRLNLLFPCLPYAEEYVISGNIRDTLVDKRLNLREVLPLDRLPVHILWQPQKSRQVWVYLLNNIRHLQRHTPDGEMCVRRRA